MVRKGTTVQLTGTQQRIINASLELFAKDGIKATTTRKIATRAHVNEVSIFRNFGNKRNLVKAILDYRTLDERLVKDMPTKWTGDVEKDLTLLVRTVILKLDEEELFLRLMLREMMTDPQVGSRMAEVPKKMKGVIIANLRKILAPHVTKAFDYETAAIFLASYFLRSKMMTILLGDDPFQKVTEVTSRTVVRIFMNGVIPRTGGVPA